MRLFQLDPVALTHIVHNMREADKDEIFATEWDDDPSKFVQKCMGLSGYAWIAANNDRIPIACFGAMPLWPGVWQAFMFATDDFRQIGLGLTKFVRKAMIPGLLDTGAHRVQAYSSASHKWAHRWLENLGAEVEATARKYGRNGEDFLVFVWDRNSGLEATKPRKA